MAHPFDLDPQDFDCHDGQTALTRDLEFEESLSFSELKAVDGGLWATTMALGEEGGTGWCPVPFPRPLPKPIDPPKYTTLALGEEGGFDPPEVTTHAVGEEGGSDPRLIGPPEATTLALGEEGGDALI